MDPMYLCTHKNVRNVSTQDHSVSAVYEDNISTMDYWSMISTLSTSISPYASDCLELFLAVIH